MPIVIPSPAGTFHSIVNPSQSSSPAPGAMKTSMWATADKMYNYITIQYLPEQKGYPDAEDNISSHLPGLAAKTKHQIKPPLSNATMLVLEPATEADATRFADIEEAAVTPDASSAVLFPGPFDSQETSRADDFKKYLASEPACRAVKVIDTELQARGEQAVVAFALWYFWEQGSEPLPPTTWGPGTNPEACEMYFGGLDRKWQDTMGGKPHACKWPRASQPPRWDTDVKLENPILTVSYKQTSNLCTRCHSISAAALAP